MLNKTLNCRKWPCYHNAAIRLGRQPGENYPLFTAFFPSFVLFSFFVSGARNLWKDKLQILRRAAAVVEMFVFSIGAKKSGGGKNLTEQVQK